MKTTYITLLFFAILLIFFLILYFINIPSPGKTIIETYLLEVQ